MTHAPRPLVWVLLAAAGLYVGTVVAQKPAVAPLRPAPKPAPAPAAGARAPLTVTFWNVEWFPGRKPKASDNAKASHLLAVTPVLEKLNPDLLGLAEVADLPAAQSLADKLKGFKVDVCSQFTPPDSAEPGKQQVVLCSRLPVLQAWAEPWKAGANGILPPRGFAVAAYQIAPREVLLAYALHLKSNRAGAPGGEADNVAMREESARQLLAHVKAMQAAYASMGQVSVLLGGDLNTSLDDPRFAAETTLKDVQAAGFEWGWKGVPLEQRYTLPGEGRYPATCFDHVFLLSRSLRVTDASLELTNKTSSDHRPVTVKLVSGPSRLR